MAESLKLREELLTLRRSVNGPEHRDTLVAMSNLGWSYAQAGRQQEGIDLMEKSLALCREALGPKHPDTLLVMFNLPESYDSVGRTEAAVKLEEEFLPLYREVFGAEHPDTLAVMYNLATHYASAGRDDEALELYEEVLPLMRKVAGPEHPNTLLAMNGLRIARAEAGRHARIAAACRGNAEALANRLGPFRHPGRTVPGPAPRVGTHCLRSPPDPRQRTTHPSFSRMSSQRSAVIGHRGVPREEHARSDHEGTANGAAGK